MVARYVAIYPGKVNINLYSGCDITNLAIDNELPGS